MYKKVAVVAFVILTFVIYSFHQRSEGGQATSQVIDTTKKSVQTTTPVTNSSSSTTTTTNKNTYKDGSFTGKSSDAVYGYIQVKATVSGGKLTDVEFLDYPQDRRNSVEINDYAMPQLKDQAIQAQSAQVDGVSGATDTSQAFIESLGNALTQAKA
jgi:uncharacterized protein with FMN-binding domain